MKTLIPNLIFLLLCSQSHGQEKFQIKVYQNTDIFTLQYFNYQTQESRSSRKFQIDRFSVAFSYKTKRLTHELEILMPEFSNSIYNVKYPRQYDFKERDDANGSVSTYSTRYELNKMLLEKSNGIKFSLGIGINPYFVLTKYNPTVSTTFYSDERIFGMSLNLIPRVAYKISEKFLLEFSIPLKIYDLRKEIHKVLNPAIPKRQQTTTGWSNSFFENSFTLRLGFAYTI